MTAEDAVAYQFLPVTVHFRKKHVRGGYEEIDYLQRSEAWADDQLAPLKVADGSGDFCRPYNIGATVLAGRYGILDCYEQRVSEVMPPFPHGELITHFRVQGDGTTSNVGFFGQKAFGETMQQCIRDVIAELEFDEPVGGICVITYALRFRTTEATGVMHVEIED
ncbi:hypothetical protein EA187_12635 [Lujinxingia sediminis]|uniref:Uncharacterized protein n=1 Tax=Lujinxingia sediminis TaxID=2480984 RepID=A0ABY0CTI7_9DELT|nr:hypothetical protein EA187_12635 [Lujinxingia sediminis]